MILSSLDAMSLKFETWTWFGRGFLKFSKSINTWTSFAQLVDDLIVASIITFSI